MTTDEAAKSLVQEAISFEESYGKSTRITTLIQRVVPPFISGTLNIKDGANCINFHLSRTVEWGELIRNLRAAYLTDPVTAIGLANRPFYDTPYKVGEAEELEKIAVDALDSSLSSHHIALQGYISRSAVLDNIPEQNGLVKAYHKLLTDHLEVKSKEVNERHSRSFYLLVADSGIDLSSLRARVDEIRQRYSELDTSGIESAAEAIFQFGSSIEEIQGQSWDFSTPGQETTSGGVLDIFAPAPPQVIRPVQARFSHVRPLDIEVRIPCESLARRSLGDMYNSMLENLSRPRAFLPPPKQIENLEPSEVEREVQQGALAVY